MIEWIVSVMNFNSKCWSTQHLGCSALRSLAVSNSAVKLKVVEAGGIAALLHSLLSIDVDILAVVEACALLRCLLSEGAL